MSESYFQFELIKKLNLENKTNNFIISPLGIELIISLCSNGAEGVTQQQMLELLKHQTIDEVNNIAKKMLVESEKNEKVKIANGILTKIKAEKNFFEKGTNDYEAKIEILEDYNTVNKWVNEKTNGKIKSIIENLSPDVMIVLLNAIYFEAFWKVKFDIHHTYEKEFFNIDNTKIYINLMFLRGKPLNYYEDDYLKAVKLDYDINDNSLNAIAILPKNEVALEKNMNELIDKLNDEMLYKIVDKLNNENSKTKVNLYLPKFEIENNFNISEILKQLGMLKAFTKEAEFKGISNKLKLFINKVLQKNYINVNEDGTQAYSITELEVMLESYLTKDETAKDFIANRPFIFIIRNEQCPKGHDIIFFTKVCKFNKVYNN